MNFNVAGTGPSPHAEQNIKLFCMTSHSTNRRPIFHDSVDEDAGGLYIFC